MLAIARGFITGEVAQKLELRPKNSRDILIHSLVPVGSLMTAVVGFESCV